MRRSERMRHTVSTYLRLIWAQFRAITEYPADFWVMAATGLIQQIVQIAFIAVVFANITTIAGWGFNEMLLLIGFMVLADAVTEVGWDGAWRLGQLVVQGEMDYLVIRPVPVMMQVGASAIGMQSVANLTMGSIMLAVGWSGVGLSLALIPVAIVLFVCAVVVQLTVITLLTSANFWLKGPSPIFAFLGAQLQDNVMRFPLAIYPRLVRTFMTWVLPFAFVNFIPVRILTGEVPIWWVAVPPVIAAAMFAVTVAATRAGLRHYESAGH